MSNEHANFHPRVSNPGDARRVAFSTQAVRASWQQRPLDITGGPPAGLYADGDAGGADEDAALTESQQIEAAVMNSLADLASRGGAAVPPPPTPRRAPARHRAETAGPTDNFAGARGADSEDRARGRNTAQHWDPVLDGTVPAGHIAGAGADGWAAEHWDPAVDGAVPAGLSDNAGDGGGDAAGSVGRYDDGVLAEAISVVEWDVQDEIPAETDREGFRRNMLVLLKDILASDGRRIRVRNGNPTFQANIGR